LRSSAERKREEDGRRGKKREEEEGREEVNSNGSLTSCRKETGWEREKGKNNEETYTLLIYLLLFIIGR
jgi:hypothetical protein